MYSCQCAIKYVAHCRVYKIKVLLNKFSYAIYFFKSVIQGVFWKDNAKYFPNELSKMPLHISKWAEIKPKETPY